MSYTPEERRERNLAAKRACDLKHREKRLEAARAYRAANPDKVYAQNHAPGAAEKRRDAFAKWRTENLDLARARQADTESRRRARMRGAGEVETVDRGAIIARDKSRCHLCGKRVAKKDIQLDHLIPVSLGGSHTAANLAVAHRSCNARKWTKPSNEQLRLVG